MVDNKRPLILVTNDDGVHAGGINSLIEMVRPYGDVVVVAPNQSHSGMSHAITVKTPLYINKIKEEDGLNIYKINGTPVDCVKLAINKILDRMPDICVSGINHGSNSSVSAHYSGTVGAAREGTINGISSIAFSLLSYDSGADFSSCVEVFLPIFKGVLEHALPEGILLNVNAPYIKGLKGARVCRMARGKWVEEFIEHEDPRHRKYFWLTGHFENFELDASDTDEYVLNNGYVSVVPLKTDVTDHDSIELFKAFNYETSIIH
ncbi:MAG: 5'/3'-nucleotidase SurE [Marinilabiliaceae bacterium]|nr:5'/3'-nucleotidase SurE [Marinilabiliaceae bacterium]